jgi:protocatechuate 3,4-dioxygenase beta subunit
MMDRARTEKSARAIPGRQRTKTEAYSKAAARGREPNEPKWNPGPAPPTVPIRVQGQATDEQGKPIRRAMIFLYSSGVIGTKLMGQATTDERGNYVIAESQLPVVTAHHGSILPDEITPYAPFVVCGIAPGMGLAWSRTQSIYAFAQTNPDDIQQRLPLGKPVDVSLAFPKAASLAGGVTDEDSHPVPGCKVQIDSALCLVHFSGRYPSTSHRDVNRSTFRRSLMARHGRTRPACSEQSCGQSQRGSIGSSSGE